MSKIQKVVAAIATALCVIIVADILLYQMTQGRIKGVDYLVLIGAGGFLIACAVNRKMTAKLSLVVLASTLSVLLIEVVISANVAQSDRPFPWYVWPPRYTCLFQPQNLVGVSPQGRFSINSRGIRGPEFSPEDQYRVLCIGGSTTECLYLDDDKTWPRVMAQTLNRDMQHTWIGNVGRSGLNAADHATLLEHLPEARMVDCWVVMCGINDMGQQIRGDYTKAVEKTWERTFVYRRPTLWSQASRPLHRNLFLYHAMEGLRKRIKVAAKGGDWTVYQDIKAKWIDVKRNQRHAMAKTADLPDLAPMLDEYEIHLRHIVRLSRESNKRLILVTQPVLWDANLPPHTRQYCLGGRTPDGSYLDLGKLADAMETFNQRMIEVAKTEGIQCVDLGGTLPKTTEVFYDDCHFNEHGAQQVAQHLAKAVLSPPKLSMWHDQAASVQPK